MHVFVEKGFIFVTSFGVKKNERKFPGITFGEESINFGDEIINFIRKKFSINYFK